jgi:hypothetical protein
MREGQVNFGCDEIARFGARQIGGARDKLVVD